MDTTTLNEVINNIEGCNCEAFSNFFSEIKEVAGDFDDHHTDEIIEFLNERMNIISEDELMELTSYEKASLSDFIANLM